MERIYQQRLLIRQPTRLCNNAAMSNDPYVFTEVSYHDTGTSQVFNDSFMELFRDSSDEEFEGFEEEDRQFGVKSRVKDFHHRTDEER